MCDLAASEPPFPVPAVPCHPKSVGRMLAEFESRVPPFVGRGRVSLKKVGSARRALHCGFRSNFDSLANSTNPSSMADSVDHSRLWFTLCLPNTHPPRSRNESVLVYQSGENVVTSQPSRIWLVDRMRGFSQVVRCLLAQGSMRTVLVVVSDVLSQYLLEMTAPEDEEPIEALSTDGADESLAKCVRSRRPSGRLDHSDAIGADTSSKLDVNFASLWRMRNLQLGSAQRDPWRGCERAESPTPPLGWR